MGQINIEGNVIPYIERKSRRAKRLIIYVQEGQVKITVPLRVSSKLVNQFIEEKKEWIYRCWKNQQALLAEQRGKDYFKGVNVLFKGKAFFVKALPFQGNKVEYKQEGQELAILLNNDQNDSARQALINWYKVQARQCFTEKLNLFSSLLGVRFNHFRLKDQKTKWGSCSSQGNINLNWRLIMAPEEVIDYVVIHELAHLRYPNHGQEFWNFVAQFVPDYKERKKWLRKNGTSLVL